MLSVTRASQLSGDNLSAFWSTALSFKPQHDLQIQIAGAAERVAQAAQGLSSLASVLPASGQLLPPTVVEADRQEVRCCTLQRKAALLWPSQVACACGAPPSDLATVKTNGILLPCLCLAVQGMMSDVRRCSTPAPDC